MARQSTSLSALRTSGHSAPVSEGESVRRASSTLKQEESNEGEHDYSSIQSPFTSKPFPYDPSLLPEGKRSLSHISYVSFWLGMALAASLILGVQTALKDNTIWRIFAFMGSLSLFHFLEFWTTATYNLPAVRASSFLLFSNGAAYNIAHSFAILEILASNFLFPSYQAFYVNWVTIGIGLAMVIVGQTARTVAMATAGTNFNHTPQRKKQDGHELVTSGIYAYSRHPSYFAFFWWAVGTQVLVGNKICLVAFFVFLWKFFYDRIKCKLRFFWSLLLGETSANGIIPAEERSLVEFFGKDYEDYRKRTGVCIPFIS
jgi:protein-S-isoprenylcysteine O-methyltransferase